MTIKPPDSDQTDLSVPYLLNELIDSLDAGQADCLWNLITELANWVWARHEDKLVENIMQEPPGEGITTDQQTDHFLDDKLPF